MFIESRFEKLFKRIPPGVNLPLRVVLWNGREFNLSAEPTVTVHIPTLSALRYFMPPDLNKLAVAFVEGRIRVEGSIHEIFRIAENLVSSVAPKKPARFHFFTRHSHRRDREAIEYHYDVSNEFYSMFLDRNMVYSCAYYRHAEDSLEKAQEQKLDHILNKLMLKPGERFLDIGCGWGALIMRAVKKYGAVATGITLSRNQFDYVQNLIKSEGLQDRCTVELRDYRDLTGAGVYDKIASVGMFEHVGLKNLPGYFGKINSLLTDDGLVLNHGITTSDVNSGEVGAGAGEFIAKYVFPEGELPHLSLALREMSAAGLEVSDVESLRRHYARTCHEWADRLEANSDRAVAIAGERRFRIWAAYLAGSAHAFSHDWINIYQVLACKAANIAAEPLPLTREYMYQNSD
ncbi:MAG: cyclopropane-fatty-acyl-phospholipid synthase family protein [Gallionella sp.]